jgi:hypothetical protein
MNFLITLVPPSDDRDLKQSHKINRNKIKIQNYVNLEFKKKFINLHDKIDEFFE